MSDFQIVLNPLFLDRARSFRRDAKLALKLTLFSLLGNVPVAAAIVLFVTQKIDYDKNPGIVGMQGVLTVCYFVYLNTKFFFMLVEPNSWSEPDSLSEMLLLKWRHYQNVLPQLGVWNHYLLKESVVTMWIALVAPCLMQHCESTALDDAGYRRRQIIATAFMAVHVLILELGTFFAVSVTTLASREDIERSQ